MINSNSRKLLLSGWLKQNGFTEYDSPLKLQKFLLFYEAFTKVKGGVADFSNLKGYKYGPVFSKVLGDYTHERIAFDHAVEQEYSNPHENIDEQQAKKSHFLVKILSAGELSELTHKLNLWNSKAPRIMKGEQQVELQESDFSAEDAKLIGLLDQMYPLELIDNSQIIPIDNHCFLFSKEDAEKLSEGHYDILSELADSKQLANPVYVELDEEGRLIVD